MNTDLLQGFYLRDLLVVPLKREISGGADAARLTAESMEVLLCLASHPGDLVTRDTLIHSVWGDTHGTQKDLDEAVGELKKSLGDEADDPNFLQTVSDHGYRLLVEPVPLESHTSSVLLGSTGTLNVGDIGFIENLRQRGVLEAAIAYLIVGWLIIQIADIVFDQLLIPAWAGTFVTILVIAGFPIAIALSWFLEFRDGRAVVHELSPKDARRRRFSRTYLSVIGAMAIAGVVVFVYDRSVGLPEAPVAQTSIPSAASVLPPIPENTIAVLPFLNVDGSGETQVFADGLADDVITRLSRVPGLLVASRGDSSTLAPNSPSQRVRERLRVARYIEGSVQLAGDRMRIIMQLIDSKSGFHVLSRSFDRAVEDFFDIRDEITELTVANVRVALPPETQAATLLPADDPSLDAYVLYRRGIEQAYRERNITFIKAALGWFDAALDVDPDYAAAHAGKCAQFVDAYIATDDVAYIDSAHASCATALTLNPNLDIVHTALGDLHYSNGEYAQAEAAYFKALDIVPNNVSALIGLGNTYMRQQNPQAAEERFRQAIGLHPGDWFAYNRLGRFLFRSGRYTEAAAEYQKVVALDSSNSTGHSNLGAAQMMAGNFAAGAISLQNAIDLEPLPTAYSNLGLIQYYLGNFDEAIVNHEKAIEAAPNDPLHSSNLGDALWIAGKHAEARKAFQSAEELAKKALAVNPNDPNRRMDLAWASAMLDKMDVARASIDRARNQAPDDPYVHYYNGLIWLRHGNTDAALSALETAAEKGYSLQMMAAEPHLASIRENPRFRAILERI
ncbi:MAG: tetratricopeptide repeat protein [Woeseiaceae bacterium]|nr:tetratricopeptide repeat protein [Woeseiaceae bacterium]